MYILLSLSLALAGCEGLISMPGADNGGKGDHEAPSVTAPTEPGVVPPGGTELQLEISSPARGATLDGEPAVTVQGTALGEVTALTLNGAALTPSADGSFSHTVQAAHGMNVLILEGTDDQGVKHKLVQTFYHSRRWLQPSSGSIERAMEGWLGQAVFDSGGARMDVATVIERALESLDVASLVPATQRIDGVLGCDHVDIKISSVVVNPATVTLQTTAEGLVANVRFSGLQASVKADLSGKWYNPACLIGVKGKVKAQSVEVTARIKLWLEGATLKASASQTSAQVHGFNIDISGIWGFLTNWLVNRFEDDLANDLEKMLTEELDQKLGPLLAKGVNGLAFDETLEAPPLIGAGAPVAVSLSSRLGSLAFEQGGARYGLDGAAVATPVVEHAPGGSIGYDCGAAAPGFSDKASYPMQLAVSDDLINQLLYGFHQGGLLRASVTQQDIAEGFGAVGGIADLQGEIDALLPPLINSCKEGGPVLQIGDLRLKLDFSLIGQPVTMEVHVAFEAPVDLQPQGNRVQLSIGEPSLLEVESKDLGDGSASVFDTVRGLFESQLMPKLIAALSDRAISVPMPELDLSKMQSSIPAGTKVRLKASNVVHRNGYVLVQGGIE